MIAADTIAPVHEPSARSDAAYAPSVDISSVASKAGVSAREWHPAPGELVSLWDMLRICAADFVTLMTTLDRVMLNMSMIHLRVAQETGSNPQNSALLRASCEGIWDSLSPLLDEVEAICRRMDLLDPISLIGCIRDRCGGKVYGIPELQGSLRSLCDLINAQLNNRVFMYVPSERAKYFVETPSPFGEKVQDKFPGITADIVDAGWYLRIGRANAAVYHLMRVMEFGVRRLARRLKLPKNLEHRPWGDILNAARTAIAALPYTSAKERNQRDRYSEAAAHLNNVKDAWRNPTMHAKCRYNQGEAEAIYSNVKTFMNYLATEVF